MLGEDPNLVTPLAQFLSRHRPQALANPFAVRGVALRCLACASEVRVHSVELCSRGVVAKIIGDADRTLVRFRAAEGVAGAAIFLLLLRAVTGNHYYAPGVTPPWSLWLDDTPIKLGWYSPDYITSLSTTTPPQWCDSQLRAEFFAILAYWRGAIPAAEALSGFYELGGYLRLEAQLSAKFTTNPNAVVELQIRYSPDTRTHCYNNAGEIISGVNDDLPEDHLSVQARDKLIYFICPAYPDDHYARLELNRRAAVRVGNLPELSEFI